ncbi:hypothetical protein [uncultured Aquimarina sp.]|uniref:hypothetical protein n=1 Tax=uncultured Aquimarina sp. TaxID=575652 RepID=UPI0026250C10|nr:hypothetical protein [uncultured Aquimarina sp.]
MKYEVIIPWIISCFATFLTFYAIKISQKSSELDRRRSVLSINRQEWINTLRDLISRLLIDIEILHALPKTLWEEKEHEGYRNVQELINKLELLLNPEEKKTEKLINSLDNYIKSVDNDSGIITQPEENLRAQIISVTQKILKEEWERVKKYQ